MNSEANATPARGSFAGYSILGELARGGMGVVYRAKAPNTNRQVAIKVLLGAGASEAARTRFLREAELTARLDDPGIVRVHDAGVEGDDPYIVYELIEGGQPFEAVVRTNPLRGRCELIGQVARALGAAHAKGIVHRDVKPENVVVDASGRARLLDFGVARGLDLERLTRTGALVGTPHYMAPEQITGRGEPSSATDVWALGVMLYWCLTGALPFHGENLAELFASIHRARPPTPSSIDPTLPRSLDDVTTRAMNKDPSQRYPDGAAFAAALEEALQKPSRRLHMTPRTLATATALVLTVSLAALTASSDQSDDVADARLPPASKAGETTLRLSVAGPANSLAHTNPVVLSGWVEGPGEIVEVTCGRVSQRVRLDPSGRGAMKLEVRAIEGKNRFTVRATDPSQAESTSASVEVLYEPWPKWYTDLPPPLRAPLPLPEGLRLGRRPGDYINSADGSALVWMPPGQLSDSPAVGTVTFSRGLFVGRSEVSWGQFRRFCAATGHSEPPTKDPRGTPPQARDGESDAVFNVDWRDAVAYCEWAGLRLPTEAEWEFAAALPPTGELALTHTFLNIDQGVREWCADRMAGDVRRIRGGSWKNLVGLAESRQARGAIQRDLDLGFRVARSSR